MGSPSTSTSTGTTDQSTAFDNASSSLNQGTSSNIGAQGNIASNQSGTQTAGQTGASQTGGSTGLTGSQTAQSTVGGSDTTTSGTSGTTSLQDSTTSSDTTQQSIANALSALTGSTDTSNQSLVNSLNSLVGSTSAIGGTDIAAWLEAASRGAVSDAQGIGTYSAQDVLADPTVAQGNQSLINALTNTGAADATRAAQQAAEQYGQTPTGQLGFTGLHQDSAQLGGGFDQYENPYTQSVVDQQIKDLDRARQIAQERTSGQAITSGAWGGARHGVADSLTNERFLNEVSKASLEGRRDAFNQAVQARGADINRLMNTDQYNLGRDDQGAQRALQGATTAAGLAGQAQGIDTQQAQALRALGVENLGQDFSEFSRQQGSELARLQGLMGSIGGAQADVGTFQDTQTAQDRTGSQATDTTGRSQTEQLTDTTNTTDSITSALTNALTSGQTDTTSTQNTLANTFQNAMTNTQTREQMQNFMNQLTQTEQQSITQALSESLGMDFGAAWNINAAKNQSSGTSDQTGSTSSTTEQQQGFNPLQIAGALIGALPTI